MTDSTNRMLQNMMKTTTQNHGDVNLVKEEDVGTDKPRFVLKPSPAPQKDAPQLANVMTHCLQPQKRNDNTPT